MFLIFRGGKISTSCLIPCISISFPIVFCCKNRGPGPHNKAQWETNAITGLKESLATFSGPFLGLERRNPEGTGLISDWG